MRLVICYDDDPARYDELARLVKPLGWVVVTIEHYEALSQILSFHRERVLAVLLDHDLRDIEGETSTGVQVVHEVLAAFSVPVIVSSANHAGAKNIAAACAEYAIPHKVISVTETCPEERWIGTLALWAVGVGR